MTILSPFPLRLDPLNTHDPRFKSVHTPYPHTNDPRSDSKDGKGKKKIKKERRKIRWGSVAYQLSFSFFILLISVLLAGSGWGLSEQALRGGRERLNIFIVLAAYVFFVSPALTLFPLPAPHLYTIIYCSPPLTLFSLSLHPCCCRTTHASNGQRK